MAANTSSDSDVFYVEQSSTDRSLPRQNTPIVLNSTEMSGDVMEDIDGISWVSLPDTSVELRTIGVFGLGRLRSVDDCST